MTPRMHHMGSGKMFGWRGEEEVRRPVIGRRGHWPVFFFFFFFLSTSFALRLVVSRSFQTVYKSDYKSPRRFSIIGRQCDRRIPVAVLVFTYSYWRLLARGLVMSRMTRREDLMSDIFRAEKEMLQTEFPLSRGHLSFPAVGRLFQWSNPFRTLNYHGTRQPALLVIWTLLFIGYFPSMANFP